MSQPDVVVYLAGWCPYCQRARSLLSKKGVQVREIDVDDDPQLREEMIARSGRRTVPQIFIGEKHVGGCDDLLALDERGELDRLLQGD
ncbi:MAG TPA: glutaredoxin 3 [Steroidobacteraceae bacterium]|jgi:glutaredoxin 3